MKKKIKLTNLSMIMTKNGLSVITRKVFYFNSPRNCKVPWREMREEIIASTLAAYTYLLPVSMQQISREVARRTYQFWKIRGWRKVKVDGKKGKKAVWRKLEKTLR